jgi:hypothetical protein
MFSSSAGPLPLARRSRQAVRMVDGKASKTAEAGMAGKPALGSGAMRLKRLGSELEAWVWPGLGAEDVDGILSCGAAIPGPH